LLFTYCDTGTLSLYLHPVVRTISKIDVVAFMEKDILAGAGVLVDARIESWFRKGTIPGSINIPFTIFEDLPGDKSLDEVLYKTGRAPTRKGGYVTVH